MSRRAARVRLDAGEIDTILGLLETQIGIEDSPILTQHLWQLREKMTSLAAKVAGQV